jgi:hypothetical protein
MLAVGLITEKQSCDGVKSQKKKKMRETYEIPVNVAFILNASARSLAPISPIRLFWSLNTTLNRYTT